MAHEMDPEMKAFCDRMMEANDPLKSKMARSSIDLNSPERIARITAIILAQQKPLSEPLSEPITASPQAATTPVTGYRFPFDDGNVQSTLTNLKAKESHELSGILERLTHGRLTSTGEHVPYMRLRPMICAIGLLLNQRGEIAPRFRPIRKYREFKNQSAREFSNDLQVLDLHWLSLHSNVLPESAWKNLFQPDFDFSKASLFTEKLRTADNKVKALGIAEQDQLLLSVIHSKATADRWQTIKKSRRDAEIRMNAVAASKASRLDPRSIPERCNEYVALRIGRGSPTAAAEVLPFIAGAATTVRAMQKRRDWFAAKGIDAN
jgi:hypothetical protein